MADEYNNAVIKVTEAKRRSLRTIVVGKIKAITRELIGERDAIFETGIGKRQGGIESSDGLVPSAPVLQMSGGGFSIYMPLTIDDEALGLVSDRPISRWRTAKIPGQAPTFDRHHHDLSDTLVLPFTFTLPVGGPALGGVDFAITGDFGDILRVSKLDASVVITKGGAAPAVVATITMNATGGVEIAVPTGQTITAGDELAEALVKVNALTSAMTSMLNAGAAVAPTPNVGTNGAVAFAAAQIAWNSAIGGTPLQTTKLMGT